MQNADHDMVNDCKSPHISLIISIIFYRGVRDSEPYITSETYSYFDYRDSCFYLVIQPVKFDVQPTEEMIRIADWLKENDPIIKTETMVFGSSRSLKQIPGSLLQCQGNQFYNWIQVSWSIRPLLTIHATGSI